MANLTYTPDLNDQFEGFSNEPLPAGDYPVVITESDVVVPKKGQGSMIKLTYEVVGGKFNGRKVFDNIVIQHPNETTQTIGKQKLNTICALCKLKAIRDTAQLHGKLIGLSLGIKTDPNYGTQNNIRKYTEAPAQATAEEEFLAPDTGKNGGKPAFVR